MYQLCNLKFVAWHGMGHFDWSVEDGFIKWNVQTVLNLFAAG
jgi:hypothetical protein